MKLREDKNELFAKHVQELLEKMRKTRGYTIPEWEFVIKRDPDFFEAYEALYERALQDGKFLSAKTREFIAIAILSYRDSPAVAWHMDRAIKLGATKGEILEAIETSIIPGGAPAFLRGLKGLMEHNEKEHRNRTHVKRR